MDISCVSKRAYYGPGAPQGVAVRLGGDGGVDGQPGTVIAVDGDRLMCVLALNEVLVIGTEADLGTPAGDDALFAVDRTGGLASLALHGDQVPHVLRRLTAFDVAERAFLAGRCAACRIAELRGLLLRVGRNDYQVHVDRPDAEHLWDAIFEAGAGLGLRVVGWDAYRSLVGGGGSGSERRAARSPSARG